MKDPLKYSIAAAAAIALAAVYWGQAGPPAEQAAARGPASDSPVAVPVGRPDAAAPTPSPVVQVVTAPQRYDEVDRLMRSGKAEDAWKAAQIIGMCRRAKSLEIKRAQETDKFVLQGYAMIPPTEQVCPGLTPGQMAAHNRLLIQAGEAAIPEAYSEIYALSSQDAEIEAARERIQLIAANNGVIEAASNRAMEKSNDCRVRARTNKPCAPEDWAEALKYRVVAEERRKALGKPDLGIASTTPQLIAMAGALADKAVEQGKEIARNSGRTN